MHVCFTAFVKFQNDRQMCITEKCIDDSRYPELRVEMREKAAL